MNMIDVSAVAFDIDGVVADTISLFIEIASDEYNITDIIYDNISSYSMDSFNGIDPSIISEIFTRIVDGDFSLPLRPLNGAMEGLARIIEKNGSALFVTARPRSEAICGWLKNALAVSPEFIEVIPTGSFEGKVDILLEKNITCFVEDRLETCFLLDEAGITPIIYNQPWNRQKHPFHKVDNWHELEILLGLK